MPYGKVREPMKIIDSKSLGVIIRERRKELNYTQAFLAEFTGLSVTFISDVERGKTTAEIGKVIQLLHILGMDILVERRG
jgi:y4mF family transcriptional regulator